MAFIRGHPKTILNYSVKGGGEKTGTFGQKVGRKLEHGEVSLFSGPNLAFLAIFKKL